MQAINLTTDMMGEVIMKNQDSLMRIMEPRIPANDWKADPLFQIHDKLTEWR